MWHAVMFGESEEGIQDGFDGSMEELENNRFKASSHGMKWYYTVKVVVI